MRDPLGSHVPDVCGAHMRDSCPDEQRLPNARKDGLIPGVPTFVPGDQSKTRGAPR